MIKIVLMLKKMKMMVRDAIRDAISGCVADHPIGCPIDVTRAAPMDGYQRVFPWMVMVTITITKVKIVSRAVPMWGRIKNDI